MKGCYLPIGNRAEFPKLDAELQRRGINAVIVDENAGRLYAIRDDQLKLLPTDEDGPYLGDDNTGHSIYELGGTNFQELLPPASLNAARLRACALLTKAALMLTQIEDLQESQPYKKQLGHLIAGIMMCWKHSRDINVRPENVSLDQTIEDMKIALDMIKRAKSIIDPVATSSSQFFCTKAMAESCGSHLQNGRDDLSAMIKDLENLWQINNREKRHGEEAT